MVFKPTVILFCGRLLPASETFILHQGEGLQQFTSYYAGTRFVKGLTLPLERTQVVNQGNLWGVAAEITFKIGGTSPRLIRNLKALKPNLVHAHFGVCGALALPLVKALKVPLIVTFHGLDATMTDQFARYQSISTRVYLHRREALKQKTQLFIATSEFIRGKLLKQGFPPDKVLVHYIGVNTKVFQANPNIIREPVVLFVGRLIEKKGCEHLIRAMAYVRKIMPHVKLVIIGDGPLKKNLKELAAQRLNHYEFLGMQPSSIVQEWMERASILVSPSITASTGDSEGLPIVILEAQAMGLPVVAFNHGGIPEAVTHGETGFLAAERDWYGLAKHIQNLLQDSILWKKISVNGQMQVHKRFNLHQQNRFLEDLYHRVLSEIRS